MAYHSLKVGDVLAESKGVMDDNIAKNYSKFLDTVNREIFNGNKFSRLAETMKN